MLLNKHVARVIMTILLIFIWLTIGWVVDILDWIEISAKGRKDSFDYYLWEYVIDQIKGK